ncbi:MAG: hypothetical protein HWN68_12960 [Desulfobacterales bacterium]|nr:hypothetical protein [Desulfobacterales bacterium]
MNEYNREQSEAIQMVHNHIKGLLLRERTRLKARIARYLRFRKAADEFLGRYFSEVCTYTCYQSQMSACCTREGITTFFADVVINVLMSSDKEIDGLLQVLSLPNPGTKCVYLGKKGCLWSIKPVVCEMFLCEHARKTVFGNDHSVFEEWEKLKLREKRYTWPDRPVLFDELEAYFIKMGYSSSLMYFHNSPGLLRVKALAGKKSK